MGMSYGRPHSYHDGWQQYQHNQNHQFQMAGAYHQHQQFSVPSPYHQMNNMNCSPTNAILQQQQMMQQQMQLRQSGHLQSMGKGMHGVAYDDVSHHQHSA